MATSKEILEIKGIVSRVSVPTKLFTGPIWWVIVIAGHSYFYTLYLTTQLATFLMTLYAIFFAGLIVAFSTAIPKMTLSSDKEQLHKYFPISTYYGAMVQLALIILDILEYLAPIGLIKEILVLLQMASLFIAIMFMTIALQDLKEYALEV